MRFFRFALTCCPHNKSKKIFNTFPCLKAVSYSPNYSSVLYHFLDKTIYLSKIPIFTARRVCIARAVPSQDVRLSLSLCTRRY